MMSNRIAIINELIQEQKSPKPILLDKVRKAKKGNSSNRGERKLHGGVIRTRVPGIAGCAGEIKMRKCRNDDCKKEENNPREKTRQTIRLINAHPSEI